ncbi:TPMT family [Trinorchestia longiramus]|nr:TPMT family [Trinorchestia longiramus]
MPLWPSHPTAYISSSALEFASLLYIFVSWRPVAPSHMIPRSLIAGQNAGVNTVEFCIVAAVSCLRDRLGVLQASSASSAVVSESEETMADEEDNSAFWASRWTEDPSWHMDEVNPHLKRHISHLAPPPGRCRIFVPLCGKSLDLKWLHSKGHSVVGVEMVEDVVKTFFEENEPNHIVKDLGWGILYTNQHRSLQIYVGDIFKMHMEELGRFDGVWDRGALVAIPESQRTEYATIIKRLLRPHFRYLLNNYFYRPAEKFQGPPYTVPNYIVHELFGQIAIWKILETTEMMSKEEKEAQGLDVAMQVFLLLTPKRM